MRHVSPNHKFGTQTKSYIIAGKLQKKTYLTLKRTTHNSTPLLHINPDKTKAGSNYDYESKYY